ncbi:MAG: L-aspartate oxidase [Deltaproteobacteria bacterium]
MRRDFDFLVIGSGIAGLSFALCAAEKGRVAVVTKARLEEGSSSRAQGGIASVWGPDDSFDDHAKDTTGAGAGLCHEDIVDIVVHEGPERVREMIERGTRFDLRPGAETAFDVDLSLEGGHSRRRILHAVDATGSEMMRVLIDRVARHEAIEVFEQTLAIDLLLSGKYKLPGAERCLGAYVLDVRTQEIHTFAAGATLIATGGAGKAYLYTSNPDVATGDGIAMAYRAGIPIGNMEFIQFHPTCLYHEHAKSFLVSETIRGEGGLLLRPDGTRFMPEYDERAELAPRDIVARAIDQEMKAHGFDNVFLDISARSEEFLLERFPTIMARCRSFGIDPATEPIPVVPAAHYTCGGIVTDDLGRTALPGLFAAGEAAMTGLHGANRLASNSLLEGLVFGHRAALKAAADQPGAAPSDIVIPDWNPGGAHSREEEVLVSQTWDEIRRLMWNYVGIVRSNRRLARARARLDLALAEIRSDYWAYHPTAGAIELRNLAMVADLIVASATLRRESRGLHYNVDYPAVDDTTWARDTILVRSPSTHRPVPAS